MRQASLLLLVFFSSCTLLVPVESSSSARPPVDALADAGVDGGVLVGGGRDAGADADDAGGGDGGRDAGAMFEEVAGLPGSSSLTNPMTIQFAGRTLVFAHESSSGALRWCDDLEAGCSWQTLDGAGGPDGQVSGSVGAGCIAAAEWAGALYLFYRQDDAAGRRVLRRATFSDGGWSFGVLDGQVYATNGFTPHEVGGCPSAVAFGSWVFVSYYDYDDHALRLAWHNAVSWDARTLDGLGGAEGRIVGEVGEWSLLTRVGASLRVYYSSVGEGLREGRWAGQGDWAFAARDPSAQLAGRPAVALFDGALHLFYGDRPSGDLVHLSETLVGWSREILDGAGADGGLNHPVGQGDVSATSTNAGLHVFFHDETEGALRHAGASSSSPRWSITMVDGHSTEGGRTLEDVGRSSTAFERDGGVTVIYEGAPGLRRARL